MAVAHNARMIAHPLKRPGHSTEAIRLTSACHRAEPDWHVASRLHRRDVPESMLRWLLDPASLTRRIQSACPGSFRVEVLFQGWARPQHNEVRVLGMRDGQLRASCARCTCCVTVVRGCSRAPLFRAPH